MAKSESTLFAIKMIDSSYHGHVFVVAELSSRWAVVLLNHRFNRIASSTVVMIRSISSRSSFLIRAASSSLVSTSVSGIPENFRCHRNFRCSPGALKCRQSPSELPRLRVSAFLYHTTSDDNMRAASTIEIKRFSIAFLHSLFG